MKTKFEVLRRKDVLPEICDGIGPINERERERERLEAIVFCK